MNSMIKPRTPLGMVFEGCYSIEGNILLQPSNLPSLLGTSFLLGNFVEFGFQGIAEAVSLPVKRSVT